MLTQETKRKIDSVRQILVGKVPDPKAQVDQITTAMIYKFMDDMDKDAMELGGKARFFTNGFEKYAWSKLMDLKLGGHERLELYAEAVVQMSTNPHIPQLFRDIFKDAFLPYRSPETLSLFLKEINSFTYDHSEDLGDAFEYLLSIMGSQGDAGQFRTPRHIIDFIVAVVDPKKDETILDPACGTAGFLISAYKHILKQHDGLDDPDHKEKPLTPDEKKKLMGNLFGYDISPDMVKLSKVNMYLHGFAEPKIFEYDTLSSDEKWDEMYDVIMANPPFMSPKGGIRPHKRFSVQANRAEVLFVDYIKEHLRQNGRAGVIVPEGIIFQTGTAYKQLRKLLVEDGLFAVVSLPGGVFNPYSGVKTSILFFDNSLAKFSQDILFVKVLNDGFDLGAQRREVNGSDLSAAVKIIKRYCQNLREDKSFVLTSDEETMAHFGSKVNISGGDYDLSSDRYKRVEVKGTQKWQIVKLGEICDIKIGGTPRRDNPEYFKGNNLWVSIRDLGQGTVRDTLEKITNEGVKESNVKLISEGTILMSFKLTIGRIGLAGRDLYTNEAIAGLPIKDVNKTDKDFLFYVLKYYDWGNVTSNKATKGATLNKEILEKIEIPLPPIRIQKDIAKQIDSYQKIIDGLHQVVSNYHPVFLISDDSELQELSEVADFFSGGTPSKAKVSFWDGEIPWVSPKDMKVVKISDSQDHISEEAVKSSSTKVVPKDTVLCVVRSGILKHSFPVAITQKEMAFNQDIQAIKTDSTKLLPSYLLYYFIQNEQSILNKGIKPGVTVQSFHNGYLKKLKIPIPTIDLQKKIIAEIEAQEDDIQKQNVLMESYKRKVQWKISQIWQNLPHFNDLFLETDIGDDFGWSPQWNKEIERWLSFIEQKDINYYKTHRNRAKNPKQRDELLGEYKAAYFIEEKAGGRIIEFEPQASASYKYDFSFDDEDHREWLAEVKSPSWRGVVSKEIDEKFMLELRGRMTIVGGEKYPECKTEMKCPSCGEVFEFIVSNIEDKEVTNEELKKLICPKCKKNLWNLSEQERAKEKAKRLSLPQFINAEGRWLGFDIFEEAIVNSLNKFEAGKNNLLVLCPNSFAEMGFIGALENWHHLREMVKRLDKDEKLTCIGVFEVSLSGEFKYHCSLVDIKGHPNLNDDATIYLDSKK